MLPQVLHRINEIKVEILTLYNVRSIIIIEGWKSMKKLIRAPEIEDSFLVFDDSIIEKKGRAFFYFLRL